MSSLLSPQSVGTSLVLILRAITVVLGTAWNCTLQYNMLYGGFGLSIRDRDLYYYVQYQ